MVIFDDLDLPVGTLRIRPKGGSGGKGVTSIIQRLGTRDFPRIRVALAADTPMDPASYVLRPFGPEEAEVAGPLARMILAIETWLTDGIDPTMNRFNGSPEDIAQRAAPTSLAAEDDHDS